MSANRGTTVPEPERLWEGAMTDIHGQINSLAILRMRHSVYEEMLVPVPDMLKEEIEQTEKSIHAMRKDALIARRKDLLNRKEQLKTAEQKRSDVDAELAKLDAELSK